MCDVDDSTFSPDERFEYEYMIVLGALIVKNYGIDMEERLRDSHSSLKKTAGCTCSMTSQHLNAEEGRTDMYTGFQLSYLHFISVSVTICPDIDVIGLHFRS